VKREGMLLPNQLRLYSVEQTAKLARAPSLTPLGKPRAKVQDKEPGITAGKRHLEQRMTRSWWMTPLVAEHWYLAEEAG